MVKTKVRKRVKMRKTVASQAELDKLVGAARQEMLAESKKERNDFSHFMSGYRIGFLRAFDKLSEKNIKK